MSERKKEEREGREKSTGEEEEKKKGRGEFITLSPSFMSFNLHGTPVGNCFTPMSHPQHFTGHFG